MAVNTINSYGKISVTDESIALVAQHTALDCYGVVENLVTLCAKFSRVKN